MLERERRDSAREQRTLSERWKGAGGLEKRERQMGSSRHAQHSGGTQGN